MKKIIVFTFLFLAWGTEMRAFSDNKKITIKTEVPAVTSNSIYITWKGVKTSDKKVRDYFVYVNDKKLPLSAVQKAEDKNINVSVYKKAFYDYYTEKKTGIKGGMVSTDVTFYCVDKDSLEQRLTPETEYTIRVEAVSKKGKKLYSSAPFTVSTKKSCGTVLDVTAFGAEMSEKITSRDRSEKPFIDKNTKAIQQAINECPEYGTVLIPEGIFMSGQLKLKSRMTLQIDGVLCGSPFADSYDDGFFMYEYYTDRRRWGLLTAENAEEIVLTGKGTVDGNGWFFAASNGAPVSEWSVYSEEGDPDFGVLKTKARQLVKYVKGNRKTVYDYGILAADCAESYLASEGKTSETASDKDKGNAYAARSTMVIFRNTRNVLIENLMFLNPANHTINIINSRNITVTGVTELTYDCNNGDGIGLCCSENAWIFNNFLDTGDDSIVFSAGVGKSASTTGQTGVKNVEIMGNYIHHGHGGVAFGSHTALGISEVLVHDNVFNHTDAPFRIKSAPANGGFVKNVEFTDNAMAFVKQAFTMSTDYNDAGTVSKYGAADKPAVFSQILCKNCTVYGVSGNSVYVCTSKESPHSDIKFKNVIFKRISSLGEYIYPSAGVTFEN